MLLIAKAERRGVWKYLAILAKRRGDRKMAGRYWAAYYRDDAAIDAGLRQLNKVKEIER